jgi:Ala-tRNA(Pro) deacylase
MIDVWTGEETEAKILEFGLDCLPLECLDLVSVKNFLGLLFWGQKMRVIDFLDKAGVEYEVSEHVPAFTAQQMAAVEHEPGRFVAKPVIVKADGDFLMCVLPAPFKIDLRALKGQLGVESVRLAEESEIGRMFEDCELGAEPPFGNLYDLPTVIDKALEADDHIAFQAGTHSKAIRMSMADYRRLVEPKVLEFGYHVTS